MKKAHCVSMLLSAIAVTFTLLVVLTLAVFLTSQSGFAQNTRETATNPGTQPQSTMPPDQNAGSTPAASVTTFTGKIVKSGTKVVLTDENKTVYQLDDQQKAQEFLNKSVKVTGVLDPSTGTIRVSAIDPA